jgi:hypothetical protein
MIQQAMLALLLASAIFIPGCGSAPEAPAGDIQPPPAWAQAANGLETEYPAARYIAQKGRGPDLTSAQNDGVARISQYFTSEISSFSSSGMSISRVNGETEKETQVKTETFVNSQTDLFAVRYASDSWYNRGEGQWETVAYIDRDEAWAIYEPQVRQRADAFTLLYQAAETEGEPFRKFFQYKKAKIFAEQELDSCLSFAQFLHPRKAERYDEARSFISRLPQSIDQSRANAGIFVDCPVDFEGIAAAALTQVLSAEGFPVARDLFTASTVCTATIEEGVQTLPAGTFYTPALRITIAGKSGSPLFSCAIKTERIGAQNPDLAKRRAYTALAGEIRKLFHDELIANSGGN